MNYPTPIATDWRSAESAIAWLNEQGITVNNLFQLYSEWDGMYWRCNLSAAEFNSDFGDGKTMLEALTRAFEHLKGGRKVTAHIQNDTHSIDKYEAIDKRKKAAPVNLSLDDLGL